MKRFITFILLVCAVLSACSAVDPANKTESAADASENAIIDNGSAVNEFEDEPDIETSVPILFMRYDGDYQKFFASLEDKSLKPLKFECLRDVFKIESIVCDPCYDGYAFGNGAGTIEVLRKSVDDSAEAMIEYHKEARYAHKEDKFFIYDSYDKLEGYEKDHEYFCMVYQKEGINVYALHYTVTLNNYVLYFVIDGQAFRVSADTFTYPHREPYVVGGIQCERIVGKLRAKDEWENLRSDGDPCAIDPALIELSDVTTSSSALIRALKEAVSNR